MDWSEWRDHLEQLVGLGAKREKVSLLIPKRGNDELSVTQAQQLADVVHKHLFGSYSPAVNRLRRLAAQPARESLPLLYVSAWLARQQDDGRAFWAPFCKAIVRDRLSKQTVQQSLAPLVSTLWARAHRELRVYRPQEGYVHVKWPQAHAGLRREEIQLLARIVAKNTEASGESPDELYSEPSEFLGLLRIWLQSEANLPKRLSRLIFGQDGPASVVAELTQKLLLQAWPPEDITAVGLSVRKLPPPYIRLELLPIRMSVVLPAGSMPGYTTLQAHCGAEQVQLETSYSVGTDMTVYRSYECPVNRMPWPAEVILSECHSPVRMRVIPDCPYTRGQLGVIMFDPATGRCARRWRPNRHYWILTGSASVPGWVPRLFTDIEMEESGAIADLDVVVLSAMGRDVVRDLGDDGALHLLQELEEELSRSMALITLPDYDELFRPRVSFSGGLPIGHGRYPVYLEGHSPLLVLEHVPDSGVALFLHKRDDDQRESLVASSSLDMMKLDSPAVFELPKLERGFYIIRGGGLSEPSYFSVVSELPLIADLRMYVSVRLLRSQDVIDLDDLRHFENQGMEITSWPYARVMLNVMSEEGSYSYPVVLDSHGKRVIRAYDVHLPENANRVVIEAHAWLAVSERFELVLQPYVAHDEWSVRDGRLLARVRGADPCARYFLGVIPEKPWGSMISECSGELSEGSEIDVDVPGVPILGWVVITDAGHTSAWLLSRIGEGGIVYDVEDLRAVYSCGFMLPSYLARVELADGELRQMCCLVRLADLARHAGVPLRTDPLNERLLELVRLFEPVSFRVIQLGGAWQHKRATVDDDPSGSGDGLLMVDGGRFSVRIQTDGHRIRLSWLENSGPCICGSCGHLMTQQQWHSHRHGNSFISLPRESVSEPVVDWSSVVDLVERSLLDAIAVEARSAPRGLEDFWTSLQESFRQGSKDISMSPDQWVKAVFASWRKLFHMVNGAGSVCDWVLLWESVEQYEAALLSLPIGKE